MVIYLSKSTRCKKITTTQYLLPDLKCINHIVRLVGSSKGLAFICRREEKDIVIYKEYLQKYNVPIND